MTEETVVDQTQAIEKPKTRKGRYTLLILLLIFILAWILVKPGVYSIQPIGALPDGVTFIYHSRNPEMPFISSPDGLCLKIQGSVSLLCRGVVMNSSIDLLDRIIIKLPYLRWAYLQSTDGMDFDR